GTNNAAYRKEAWVFLLAGGGLYNNLDFSFTAGHERGDFVYPENQPGGGNAELRREIRVLRDFINSFEFVRMKPDKSFIKSCAPEQMHVYALAEPGKQYAACFFSGTNAAHTNVSLTLNLPNGSYRAEWIDIITGKATRTEIG